MKSIRTISIAALVACMAVSSATYARTNKQQQLTEAMPATVRVDKNISIYNDVMRQLDINYTDTLNYDKLTETAINEMLRQVDPYTIYVPESKDEELKRMTTGKYGGIGSTIMQREDYVYISDPYEGLPAQKNDVRAGDKILSVDGVNCKGKTTQEVSNMLRGKANTLVKLELERPGEKKPIKREFMRQEIKFPTIDYAAKLTDNVGYVSFTEFTENSSRELRLAIQQLVDEQGCKSLILDLRGNGGGLINEAINIVSMFVEKSTEVVSTKGKTEGSDRVYKTTTEPIYLNLPLTILVDRNSASASEITCGALQDLSRATLVGEKTFGKGLVQSIRPIVYEGHLKVTTARYYLPSGRCIQGTGIEPDIKLEDSTKVNICYELYQKHMFFDYATEYRLTHAEYPCPSQRISLDKPELTAEEKALLEDFEAFLEKKQFTYETETSKYFADVLRFAEKEDLDSAMMADLQAMKTRLATTYHDALWKHAEEVLSFLQSEIASRYYFQQGRTCIGLRRDTYLMEAIRIAESKLLVH